MPKLKAKSRPKTRSKKKTEPSGIDWAEMSRRAKKNFAQGKKQATKVEKTVERQTKRGLSGFFSRAGRAVRAIPVAVIRVENKLDDVRTAYNRLRALRVQHKISAQAYANEVLKLRLESAKLKALEAKYKKSLPPTTAERLGRIGRQTGSFLEERARRYVENQ